MQTSPVMRLGLNANIASDASKLRFWEPSLIPTYSELWKPNTQMPRSVITKKEGNPTRVVINLELHLGMLN